MKFSSKVVLGIFALIFLLIVVSNVSAVSSWKKFGGDQIYISNSEFQSVSNRFNLNVSKITITRPNTLETTNVFPYQPLVVTISDQNYIFIQNGNYVQIIDKYQNLVSEIYSGAGVGQMSFTDFDSDLTTNETAGFFRNTTNSSNLDFRIFSLNSFSNINQTYHLPIAFSGTLTSSGVRCISNHCYGFIQETIGVTRYNYLLEVYKNGSSINYIADEFVSTPSNRYIIEPVNIGDADGDGLNEFLGYNQDTVFYFEDNLVLSKNFSYTASIGYARFIDNDASNQLRIVVTNDVVGTSTIAMYRIDGTVLWSKTIVGTGGDTSRFMGLALADYNNDGYEDVFTVANAGTGNPFSRFTVYDGEDGALLYSISSPQNLVNNVVADRSLTVGHLDNDGVEDFILTNGNNIYLWNTQNQVWFINTSSTGVKACVPADYNYDNLLDVVCSGTSETVIFTSNYSNQNPTINTITFDPSLSILTGQTLTAIISANDVEDDIIYYSIRCSSSANYSSPSTNPSQTCLYSTVGTYNLSVRVNDFFHTTYAEYSTIITVTTSGSTCNLNAVCEAGLGETFASCPSDCQEVLTNQSTSTGTMTLPTELVDTENINRGLFPTIYYSIMIFLSYALYPFIVVVFLMMIAMVSLLMIRILHKFVSK